MIYYRHFPTATAKISHVTLAGTFREGNFYVAVSLCSRKDMFSRRIGRTVAEERLVDAPILIPKSAIYAYCAKFCSPIFKLPALETAIASAPIYDFNINTLFEAALLHLFAKDLQ